MTAGHGEALSVEHIAAWRGQANTKAAQVAQSLNVTPPAEPNAKHKSAYDRLSKLTGTAFDKAFASHMVADHKKDIKEYEKEAKKDDAAGAYAKEALPTLHKHLETAQSLSGGATSARR